MTTATQHCSRTECEECGHPLRDGDETHYPECCSQCQTSFEMEPAAASNPTAGDVYTRLAYLRTELRAERISYGELSELQSLIPFIDPGDVELLEAAGVPEFGEGREQQARDYAATADGDCLNCGGGQIFCRHCRPAWFAEREGSNQPPASDSGRGDSGAATARPWIVHVTDGGAVYISDSHDFSKATFAIRADGERERAERIVQAVNGWEAMRELLNTADDDTLAATINVSGLELKLAMARLEATRKITGAIREILADPQQ